MDENYSPGVSDVKVAKIIDKDDTEGVLELQYIGELNTYFTKPMFSET